MTIMFANPRDMNLYCVPLSLIKTEGHTATQVAEMMHVPLTGFGFSCDDLMHSIHDNTSLAIFTKTIFYNTADKESAK